MTDSNTKSQKISELMDEMANHASTAGTVVAAPWIKKLSLVDCEDLKAGTKTINPGTVVSSCEGNDILFELEVAGILEAYGPHDMFVRTFSPNPIQYVVEGTRVIGYQMRKGLYKAAYGEQLRTREAARQWCDQLNGK